MSETPPLDLLQSSCKGDTMQLLGLTRDQLIEFKRQLISLLVIVQRLLGEEPIVLTRSERRKG